MWAESRLDRDPYRSRPKKSFAGSFQPSGTRSISFPCPSPWAPPTPTRRPRRWGGGGGVLGEGVDVINDISGLGFDPRVASVVAEAGAGLILGHMRGTPRTMQQDPRYADLLVDVREHLRERILLAEAAGVHPEAIVVDPGIGFGKSVDHNLLLLKCLPELHGLKKPILVGPSRKSFIGRILDLPIEERTEGTAAAVAVAIWQGAHIVRVHDVRATVRVARMTQAIRGASGP